MKKLLLITIIYWGVVGVFFLLNKQDNDSNASFPPKIIKMVRKYPPLQPKDINATGFIAHIQKLKSADRSTDLKMNYEFSIFYPSKGRINIKLDPDSILPSFELKYTDFDSFLIKERVKPIIESMYLNEYHQHEFRFESYYPVRDNLAKEICQQLNLEVFEPENPKLNGLITEPVDALDGARIELIYKLSDNLRGDICIDESKPLVYEIKFTADTVSHILSYYLKDHQFFDIRVGMVDLSIIPPPRYDYTCITRDNVGDLVYLDTVPLLVSAFENGMLHLVFDGRMLQPRLEDFYFSEKGEFLDSKIEGVLLDFPVYHIYRKNTHMDAEVLSSELRSRDNMLKYLQDVSLIERSGYYRTLIVNLGCDPDEVHILKKRAHYFDDILGSRIMSFSFDTAMDEYRCTLLKKDKYGILRALHEDTTRTEPKYQGLVEELKEYVKYPLSFNIRDAINLQVQAMVHKDGRMTDIKLYAGSGDPLLDEDALNAVTQLKHKWEPATLHGEPIDMGVIIPLYYEKR